MIATPAHEIPLDIRRKAVAVHEAGHALVALLHKRDVTGAALHPPHGLSGETRFAGAGVLVLDLNAKADRHFIEDAIVILLAGQIAEAHYWKQLAPLYIPRIDSHRTDDAEIQQLRSHFALGPEQQAMFMGYCTDKASRIVLHPNAQAAIADIAARLSDTLSISRGELDEIMGRHDVGEGKLKFARHPWERRV
ncbi:hypothetical protein [Xanthobacter versatilis]|uniref:hypothetical protein n=1 Tax=Xanthobacter autotrophicus (strain ATCC BAA-1158 / Py2) TaxID=78245 RepID=UPI00372B7098